MIYSKTNEAIHGYSDSDWAGDEIDRVSQTGYVFIMAGAAISWKSTKQRSVASSSTEAEYYALHEASNEALWLLQLTEELNIAENPTIKIYVDNQSTIKLANNEQYQPRTKHIAVKYHSIRERIKSGKIKVEHINTNANTSDAFTKAMTQEK